MRQRDVILLVGIIVVVLFSAWVAWPSNPGLEYVGLGPLKLHLGIKPFTIHQGLDLRGGTQVLLEADPQAGQQVTRENMDAARAIVENRVNGLGVSEPVVQAVGDRRIIVEVPGGGDQEQLVSTFRGTGRLEFIDAGGTYLEQGTVVKTTFETGPAGQAPAAAPTTSQTPGQEPTATASATIAPTATVTPTTAPTATVTPTTGPTAAAGEPTAAAGEPTAAAGGPTAAPTDLAQPTPTPTPEERVFTTVLTGKDLKEASVATDELGRPEIHFTLNPDGAKVFGDFTAQNVDRFLAITMDGRVISCPRIESAITEGEGRITSQKGFPLAEAQGIVVQLKYGALPIPLKVIEQRHIGPTLGQDSVARSVRAGVIGLFIVLLFMLVYYRLPGVMADLALLTYAVVTLAIFKIIPVTLTLPGVTGFLMSVGMAVDANILIFERMKEELRHGRSLAAAIDAGFNRAWTSIRDSNLSTLITCVILFWFGSTYGASAVKGFAVTLFLGVMVSMFTAITVTRTLMRATFALAGDSLREKHRLLGA